MSNYDLLINGLNEPTNEELGKAVKEMLWSKKPKGLGSYREIVVGLS